MSTRGQGREAGVNQAPPSPGDQVRGQDQASTRCDQASAQKKARHCGGLKVDQVRRAS